MTKQQPTVERSFDLVKPSGVTTRFTVSYGPVYQRDQLFFCPVRFTGWANPPPDIQGDDSLDALLQAVRLVHAILRDFRGHGGRVLYSGMDADYLLESIVTDEPSINQPPEPPTFDASNPATRPVRQVEGSSGHGH